MKKYTDRKVWLTDSLERNRDVMHNTPAGLSKGMAVGMVRKFV
jgi:hypothetical protein